MFLPCSVKIVKAGRGFIIERRRLPDRSCPI
jgi:hypothetical protein